MVKGLAHFAEHFRPFLEHYTLIGGAACDLLHEQAGLEFRLTKDLDIVLTVDALTPEFSKVLWEYIREGEYEVRERGDGVPIFYRFKKPKKEGYPAQIELFSKMPGGLQLPEDAHITPVPVNGTIVSLSAILLNEEYYSLVQASKIEISNISTVRSDVLMVLKATAFLGNSARKAAGQEVRSIDIIKHKLDFFRLYRIIDPQLRLALPKQIKSDIQQFLNRMAEDKFDVRVVGIRGEDTPTVLANVTRIFELDFEPTVAVQERKEQ